MFVGDTGAGRNMLRLQGGMPNWERLQTGPTEDSWEGTANKGGAGSLVPLIEEQRSRK